MGERRTSRRTKSFLRGVVYVSRERGALSCLIRDLSDKGARIIFSDAVTLPDVFELHIPQREETLRAKVRWRHGQEVGLAFVSAGQSHSDDAKLSEPEVAQRVAMLEAEIASLRTMLKRLKGEKARTNDEAA
jgi:uncharacterized small protein (DUF1192 family)